MLNGVGSIGTRAQTFMAANWLRSSRPSASLYVLKASDVRLSGHAHRCGSSSWSENAGMPAIADQLAATLESVTISANTHLVDSIKPAFSPTSPLRAPFEAGRHIANTVLKAVDSPVQLSVATVETECTETVKEGSQREHISTWSGTTLIANKEIQTYVDNILAHSDDVVNNPWIPDVIERRVYMLVVKMVLQMVHFSCGVLDGRKLFGLTVRIVQSRSSSPLERVNVTLCPDMVDAIIQQVMVDSGESTIISQNVDRLLYQNAIRFALRLVVDMASSLHLSTFGLNFRVKVELDTQSMLKNSVRSPLDVGALERLCEPLIRELLADDDINITLLPDHLEEQIYKNVLRLLANIAAAAADSSEINLFGTQIIPDIM